MDANPPEKTPKWRWRDAVAFVAAVAVSLPIIMGVRAITSEHVGLAAGTLAGLFCAAIVVYGINVAVNSLPNRHD